MRKFLRAWENADPDLAVHYAKQDGAEFDDTAFRHSILDGDPEHAFTAFNEAVTTGVAANRLLDSISLVASERFRRFDIGLDADDTNEWGWLDVTHNLTYLDALRWAWGVAPSPDLLRGLYHALWFVNFTKQFDRREGAPDTRPYAVDDANLVLETIRKKDPEGAVATIAGYDGPEANLHGALAQGAAEDNSVAPIMVAHTVKTTRAAIVESEVLGSREPLIAAGRFLASPKRERFVYNATLEAIDFAKGRARGEGK